jgi:hypothetical protein
MATRKVGKYVPPAGNQAGVQPGFSAAVQNVAGPQRALNDLSFLKDPAFSSFVEEGKNIILDDRPLAGNDLANWVKKRAFPNGLNFGDPIQPDSGSSSGGGGTENTNNPLMSAISGYAKNISNNSGPMGQLQKLYDRLIAEIGTQSKTGRADINRSTEQALAALNTQINPYANLRMADIPAVTDPMSAYSQAVGAPTGGIEALQQMLQSNNAATGSGFNNLAQLLGASNTASQQSRVADVQNARTQGLQDLAQNQRTSNLAALQSLLSGQQGQQQVTQGRQDQLMQQLLGLAGQGIDVSQIMALLGGQ